MKRIIKYCKRCGKELSANQRNNSYCSTHCAGLAKKEEMIVRWRENEISGLNKGNQLSHFVRNYLLEKSGHRCELCGWGEKNPTTGLVPLEIHHIDGNYFNNVESNLQVLCPNCHSLTPNYKALNSDSNHNSRTRERKWIEKYKCVDCGVAISYKSNRCRSCENKRRRDKDY